MRPRETQDLRDGDAGGEIVGIRLEGGLQVRQRLFDLGAVVAGAVEQHAAEDAIGVVEVRRLLHSTARSSASALSTGRSR